MDTKELIESIIAGDEEVAEKFVESMDERVSDALEVRKVEIASGLIEAKMKDDENKDEDEDEDEDEDDEDEKSMKKEEVESVDEAKFETRASWRTGTPEVIYKNNKKVYAKLTKTDPDKAEKFRLKFLVGRKKEAMAEEAEQIDELKKSTLASYATKAATNVRTATNLARGFEDQKYRAMKRSVDNSPYNMTRKKKDPQEYKDATRDMETAEKLQRDFERQAKNRIKGIGRAAAKLAKEELKREFDPKDEYPRDQNHPDSYKLKAPKELRKNPKFANRKMKEEVEQMDEADKLAGLDYNKGHKLMYKDGKQKIVKTAGSQQAHKAMGWKERHSVKAAMKEQAADFDKNKSDSEMLSRLNAGLKTGAAPKLSPAELEQLRSKGLDGKIGNVNYKLKSVTVKEQSVAPGKRQSYEQLPNGGVADPSFSKSVEDANKQTAAKMQQKVNAMKARDAENEKNRPPAPQNEAAQLSDQQKLMMMKTKNPGMVRTAMARYRKVGDVNKLSPAHRTLVAGYLEKTGGIDDLPRTVAAKLLKPKNK